MGFFNFITRPSHLLLTLTIISCLVPGSYETRNRATFDDGREQLSRYTRVISKLKEAEKQSFAQYAMNGEVDNDYTFHLNEYICVSTIGLFILGTIVLFVKCYHENKLKEDDNVNSHHGERLLSKPQDEKKESQQLTKNHDDFQNENGPNPQTTFNINYEEQSSCKNDQNNTESSVIQPIIPVNFSKDKSLSEIAIIFTDDETNRLLLLLQDQIQSCSDHERVKIMLKLLKIRDNHVNQQHQLNLEYKKFQQKQRQNVIKEQKNQAQTHFFNKRYDQLDAQISQKWDIQKKKWVIWLFYSIIIISLISWYFTLRNHTTELTPSGTLERALLWWGSHRPFMLEENGSWIGMNTFLNRTMTITTGLIALLMIITVVPHGIKILTVFLAYVLFATSFLRLLTYYLGPYLFVLLNFGTIMVNSNNRRLSFTVIVSLFYAIMAGHFAALSDPLNMERHQAYMDFILIDSH